MKAGLINIGFFFSGVVLLIAGGFVDGGNFEVLGLKTDSLVQLSGAVICLACLAVQYGPKLVGLFKKVRS